MPHVIHYDGYIVKLLNTKHDNPPVLAVNVLRSHQPISDGERELHPVARRFMPIIATMFYLTEICYDTAISYNTHAKRSPDCPTLLPSRTCLSGPQPATTPTVTMGPLRKSVFKEIVYLKAELKYITVKDTHGDGLNNKIC